MMPLPVCEHWSSPYKGSKDKEGVAGTETREGELFGQAEEGVRATESNRRDGSYCDNVKMERDRGEAGRWLACVSAL